ncbi:WD-40 repeat protein [Rivularia sp. IAM M-261]|nr:WD-40 repeat protein [Rivularia sp. IAM M-261]
MLPPIDLNSLVQAITGIASPILKDKLQRNETVIKILQKFNLAPDHPPSDFSGIYAYALVEYGIGKPQVFLELFRDEEIKKAFRTAFDNNNPSIILSQINNYLDTHALIEEITNLGIDARRELAAFYLVFSKVAKTSRTPSDVLLSQQITTLNQKLDRIPTLEGIRAEIAQILSQDNLALPNGTERAPYVEQCKAMALAQQMRGWFETLGYRFEKQEVWRQDFFEWIINIPVRRNRYDRVLIRGIAGEAQVNDVLAMRSSVERERADEGWLVTARRISRAARTEVEKDENKHLGCYTFDELLAQDADFSGYLEWLEAEITRRQIDTKYVPLACSKEEIDLVTGRQIAVSRYEEEDGWIDGYIDRWLDDPVKEHISVLGEFGTGKTWFVFHYAWVALQRYKDAQKRGVELPRLPLVIPLRDYAKAVSVESLFSEFFFRKHEIPLPGYSAFEQLNRMGKLLLIFDGFDEMAARVDRQEMINNFWELAKVVVPGAKVILTCRSEHFPEAKEGRALLSAELQASTALLTGETPQFEVLELEKFNDEQIKQVLLYQATSTTVEQVMNNPQLLDLARRPVMTELILEALPDIEAGKPIDMSRVYLYAVRRKIENDITQKRTFTSSAEKLYFLCELSWEMLSTEQMSLNYRLFPDRIRRLFGAAVQEEKDLDHWQFDMMGQTMLIRNADGDYTPAHRSLLEFFVAYKFAAEIGALADDFTELAREEVGNVAPTSYTWSSYFGRNVGAPLDKFIAEPLEKLRETFGKAPLSKAVLDLMAPMIDIEKKESIIRVIESTRGRNEDEVSYVGGNAATLVLKFDQEALKGKDFSGGVIKEADFNNASLQNTNFTEANLKNSLFTKSFANIVTITFSPDGKYLAAGSIDGIARLFEVINGKEVFTLVGHTDWIVSIAFSTKNNIIATASGDYTIRFWNLNTGKCLKQLNGHTNRVCTVAFSCDEKILASAGFDMTIRIWDVNTGNCLKVLQGHEDHVISLAFSPDKRMLATRGKDLTIRLWNTSTWECFKILQGYRGIGTFASSISFSPDGKMLASIGKDNTIIIWDTNTFESVKMLEGYSHFVRSVNFSPNGKTLAASSDDGAIRVWDVTTDKLLKILHVNNSFVRSIAFNPDSNILASSQDNTVRLWNINSGESFNFLQGYSNIINSAVFSPDGKTIASGSQDCKVYLWDVNTAKILKIFKGHNYFVNSVAFSPDGKYLASNGDDDTLKLWDILSGECIKTLQGHENQIRCVAFSPNGKFLASGSQRYTVHLWDVLTGKHLKSLQGHTAHITSVAFSQSSKMLASGCRDCTVRLWDVETSTCLQTLKGHTNWVRSVLFSPDDNFVVSASEDKTLRLWNTNTGECLRIFQGHTNWLSHVDFSPNGDCIVSSSYDETLKLWNVHTGECLKTFKGHTSWIHSAAFSPNGKTLVSSSHDETMKIWSIETGECLKTLRSPRPYENMNITGATGLTTAEKATLKALGAIDEQDL